MIRRRLCELIEQIPELPRYLTLGDDVPPLPTGLEVHKYSYLYLYSYLVLECKFSWTKSNMYASYHPSQLYLPLGSFKYLHVSLLP